MAKQMTQAELSALEDIRDTIEEWLQRQPSFSYDPQDIAVDLSQQRWARVWGLEDLSHDENVSGGSRVHVIHFTLHPVDGVVTSARQHCYSEQTAKAIGRGRASLDEYGPDIPHDCADAAQDAIVDIMEALEYYGLDGPAALVAAKASWDHDRQQH